MPTGIYLVHVHLVFLPGSIITSTSAYSVMALPLMSLISASFDLDLCLLNAPAPSFFSPPDVDNIDAEILFRKGDDLQTTFSPSLPSAPLMGGWGGGCEGLER